ncbi:MAG TPA: hypothetical protein ENI22_00515 [Candidatus Pacearchaeota archaeon]|nr:hypothetical protein [Candidatus Pacearchaeota archaeon]
MARALSSILLVLYIIFGLYFLNYPFNLLDLSGAFSSFEEWIFFLGGILIIIGAINHFRLGRYRY